MSSKGDRIADVVAYASSFPVKHAVMLGIGRTVKRDTVVVKVTTADGVMGWGEAHHGRCPGAVAAIVNTTLRQLVLGLDALDVVGMWSAVYAKQLASHGMGAAGCMALSGIDMALWDIRAKIAGWPLYRLLGGSARPISAYAGGISLGHQPPDELCGEAAKLVEQGFRAVKLRLGDTLANDAKRVRAVRSAFPDLDIMTDANAAYSVSDVRHIMPVLDECDVAWLEEPFPPHDHRNYRDARAYGHTPFAAGENHYTRFEFHRVLEDGAITVIQPDLSKTGGITETLRIAAMASAYKHTLNPHTSATGINMAASLHVLSAIDNPGYYEADVAAENLFRDELTNFSGKVTADGTLRAPEGPGLGVEVDEEFLRAHPVIEGPAYV